MLNISKLFKYVLDFFTYGCAAENTTMNNNNNTKAAHIHDWSCESTMYAHEAADTVGSVPQKIAATDKNNIFLFSVAASDGKVSASSTPR